MKRDITIDIAKGIGIVLVVLGHVLIDSDINRLIYLFHMPLFFFISGIIFYSIYNKNIKFKDYLLKKIKSILVSYFIFSIICFIYWYFIEREIRLQPESLITNNFYNIFLAYGIHDYFLPNVVMWFLACLFCSYILFYFINKFKYKSIISLILLFIGLLLSHYDIRLPWLLDSALVAQFIMYCGYKYKEKNLDKVNYFILVLEIIISIIVLYIFMKYNIMTGSIFINNYHNFIYFMIVSISGTILVLNVSKLINLSKIVSNVFSYLGKNSIIIMICHEPIKRIILLLYSIYFDIELDIIRSSLSYSLLITFIVIFVLVPIIFIINRYLPFMIGRKKVKE